jgi:uncharacterized membrane protein YhaH (DUF805 family)
MMGFSDAVAEGLGKYAVFQGRARRSAYWWFVLFNIGTQFVAQTIDLALKSILGFGLFSPIAALALFVPTLALGVRRLHDRNLTGWWMLVPVLCGIALGVVTTAELDGGSGAGSLIAFLALVAWLGLVVTLALPGTPGPNRFGVNPAA